MKRVVLALLAAALGLILAGCRAEVPSASKEPSLPEPDGVTLDCIVDVAEAENIPTDTALELFWSDGEHEYFFPTVRSQYVTVFYSDGTRQSVNEALEEGRVAIADLDAFGISYIREEIIQVVDIVDRTETEFLLTADALEEFWLDEEYHYYFPSIKSQYIIVHYGDGSQRPVREAMERGDVTFADLDRFGIGYYREEIVTAVGMECKEGMLDAPIIFWSDEEYDYWFPTTGTEVTVLLSDGHSWPLQDALMAELVTVSDLDRYGIRYYKEPRT